MVVGYLPEGVAAVGHAGIVLDGAMVVMHGIEDGTGVEVVLAVHLLAGERLVVLSGLVVVPEYEAGLGDDPRKPLPALRRSGIVYPLPLAHGEGVVFLIELAVNYIELTKLRESRIRRRLPERGFSLSETAVVVIYDPSQVTARSCILGEIQSLQYHEELQRLLVSSQGKLAVAALEDVFCRLLSIEDGGVDLG